VIARSPVVDSLSRPGWAESVVFNHRSGALVFATGTNYWSHGLGKPGVADAHVQRMMANVIEAAVGVPVPNTIGAQSPRSPSPPAGPFASSVSTVATDFTAPAGVAVLPGGTVAVVDARTHRVLGIPKTGKVGVIAGSGQPAEIPYHEPRIGKQASFLIPTSIVAEPAGSMIVADTANHCLRRISSDDSRLVTVIAGRMGEPGAADGVGAAARFNYPMGLAFEPAGTLLVADQRNHRIRRFDPGTGATTTVAGSSAGDMDGPALTARLSFPTAVAASPDGRIFVVASGSARIAVIGTDPENTVTTLAGLVPGFRDGAGDTALLGPQGGAAWLGDALLVSDPINYRIRRIVPGPDAASTTVHTFAGSGNMGRKDGAGASSTFGLPLGLSVAPDGTVFVADAGTGSVRAIRP
jgi:hypothetical protein